MNDLSKTSEDLVNELQKLRKDNETLRTSYEKLIIENKKAESAFRVSEEKLLMFANAIRSVSECISITDMADKIIFVNRAFLKTYQYEEHELLGKHISIVRSSNNSPSFVEEILPATMKGGWQGEVMNQKKDGSEFPVYISTSVILNEDNKPIALIGITNDISKRKLADEELKRKNEQLYAANMEKDKFFSIIAHDLRSPFNTFLGFTRMIADNLPSMDPEKVQKIAAMMKATAINLNNLLENLLTWAQSQKKEITFNPSSFPLLPKISNNTVLIMESAFKKEIEVSYFNISEDLAVFADENMLGFILRNLTTNAVKFTENGGKIIIAAKQIPGNSVEVSIKDTGIGMKKEMVDNLFRLDSNTNRKGTEGEPSTGLGLIICKEFIEKHGGKIWVESEEGKGTTFFFTLPGKAHN